MPVKESVIAPSSLNFRYRRKVFVAMEASLLLFNIKPMFLVSDVESGSILIR